MAGQAPIPLLAGIVPVVGTQNFLRSLRFATAPGWYILYGIVVRAGANALDPGEWSGWNPAVFYPFVVPSPFTPP